MSGTHLELQGRTGPTGRRVRSLRRALALGVAGTMLVAACGGGDDGDAAAGDDGGSSGGGGEVLTVLAYDRLAFDAETYEVAAGEITFEYVNEGVIPHTLLVEGHEDEMKLTVNSGGDTAEGSLTLEPGTYLLYCDVPGHEAGGMVADLVVE